MQCQLCNQRITSDKYGAEIITSFFRAGKTTNVLHELLRVKGKYVSTDRLMEISHCPSLHALHTMLRQIRIRAEEQDYRLDHSLWAGYRIVQQI